MSKKLIKYLIVFIFISPIFSQTKIYFNAISIQNLNKPLGSKIHNFKSNGLILNPQIEYDSENISMNFSPLISNNNILFNSLFLKINTKVGFIKLGNFYSDNSDFSHYSSGNLFESQNSLPYFRLDYFNNFKIKDVRFDINISNGIFDENQIYLDAPYIHRKSLFLTKKLKKHTFSIGMTHGVIWGGNVKSFGAMPSTLDDFFRIFLGRGGDDKTSDSEKNNALGDAFGAWDFIYDTNFGSYKIKLYHQYYFEDRSGLKMVNKFKENFDGLWGIELSKNNDFNVLLEYLNTRYQGGNTHPPGLDSYYWNGVYSSGWVYKGAVIGNPYIEVFSNRAEVLTLGISKQTKDFNFSFLINKHNQYKYSYNGSGGVRNITIDLKNDIAKTNIFSTIGFSKAISKNFTIETFLSKDKYNKISSLINLNIVIKE